MGHLAARDVYRDLGRAIDGLDMRAPWSETLRAILRELYSEEEAELVSRMPTGLAPRSRIARLTGIGGGRLDGLLESLASKGLIMDLEAGGEYRYAISPFVIGVFEFTMMRTDGGADFPRLAGLFKDYLAEAGGLFEANAGGGQRVSVLRTIPHGGTVADEPHVEVLDHERAEAILDRAPGIAVGICSCRHERLHLGEKRCSVPLATCISFGDETGYVVRRKLARLVSREEARDLLALARAQRLVLNADNVRKDVGFLCLCCACCCNVLTAIRRFGFPNILVTSRFIARCDEARCTGCGACAKACPIEAIAMSDPGGRGGRERRPRVDASFCIGCGVCALACPSSAMRLLPRAQRIILPENTVERVILQSLERGTLQNFLIDNPNLPSRRFARAVVGAFLSLPPVKRLLMSEGFRSRFLSRIAG